MKYIFISYVFSVINIDINFNQTYSSREGVYIYKLACRSHGNQDIRIRTCMQHGNQDILIRTCMPNNGGIILRWPKTQGSGGGLLGSTANVQFEWTTTWCASATCQQIKKCHELRYRMDDAPRQRQASRGARLTRVGHLKRRKRGSKSLRLLAASA